MSSAENLPEAIFRHADLTVAQKVKSVEVRDATHEHHQHIVRCCDRAPSVTCAVCVFFILPGKHSKSHSLLFRCTSFTENCNFTLRIRGVNPCRFISVASRVKICKRHFELKKKKHAQLNNCACVSMIAGSGFQLLHRVASDSVVLVLRKQKDNRAT